MGLWCLHLCIHIYAYMHVCTRTQMWSDLAHSLIYLHQPYILSFLWLHNSLESLTSQNIDQMLTGVVDWHTLGIKLGIPDHSLGEIQSNYGANGIVRMRQEMIKKWLIWDEDCSWCKLAHALEEMELHVVVRKIREKYTSGYDSKFTRDICVACTQVE